MPDLEHDSAPELLPCPFCGSTNVAQGASRDMISVWCFCGAQGPSVPFPEINPEPIVAIYKCYNAWNRRAALRSQSPEPLSSEPVDDRPAHARLGGYDAAIHETAARLSQPVEAQPIHPLPMPKFQDPTMVADADGQWVRLSDYQALKARLSAVEGALKTLGTCDLSDLPGDVVTLVREALTTITGGENER